MCSSRVSGDLDSGPKGVHPPSSGGMVVVRPDTAKSPESNARPGRLWSIAALISSAFHPRSASFTMNKAFTRESDAADDDDDDVALPALPQGTRNYVTP